MYGNDEEISEAMNRNFQKGFTQEFNFQPRMIQKKVKSMKEIRVDKPGFLLKQM